MARRLTQREYIALIAVISAVVLVLGVLLKPKRSPVPTISGEETQRLQTLIQRRNLENLAGYFSEVSEGIQPGLVWLEELASTGLVWNDAGLIVTAGPAGTPPLEVAAVTTSGSVPVKPQILSGNFRVASLQAPDAARPQPVLKGNPDALAPGTWIIQVARQAKGNALFTPGVFGGLALTRCGSSDYQTVQSNLPLTESALGGGFFDVDGNLLALVVRCDDHFAALVPAEVDRELARAASFEGQLLRRYGFQVANLDDPSRRYFQVGEGVLVTAVTDGQVADAAGVIPGDVITALDKGLIVVPEDLRPLITAEDRTGVSLEIRRNRRTIRIDLAPAPSANSTGAQGSDHWDFALADPSQGYLVQSVPGGSRTGRASIHAGDRVLLVDGAPPRTMAAVYQVLSAANPGPVFLVLRRASQKIGVFLHANE